MDRGVAKWAPLSLVETKTSDAGLAASPRAEAFSQIVQTRILLVSQLIPQESAEWGTEVYGKFKNSLKHPSR